MNPSSLLFLIGILSWVVSWKLPFLDLFRPGRLDRHSNDWILACVDLLSLLIISQLHSSWSSSDNETYESRRQCSQPHWVSFSSWSQSNPLVNWSAFFRLDIAESYSPFEIAWQASLFRFRDMKLTYRGSERAGCSKHISLLQVEVSLVSIAVGVAWVCMDV